MNKEELLQKVEQGFIDKNLHTLDGSGQFEKLIEEVNELEDAYIKGNRDEEIDAVGDITVVVIRYCLQRKLENIHELISFDDGVSHDDIPMLLYAVKKNSDYWESEYQSGGFISERIYVVNTMGYLKGYCRTRGLDFWECLESAYKRMADNGYE